VAIIGLEFRDATNLDTHPIHFHSTKWQIVDANHLVQGWYIAGGTKPNAVSHMKCVKRIDKAT
jgi:FtsP/CotA-like multicopper oxidase with cupredoxin domain